ncbi:hypothetical protein QFC22_002736 [Naganishia vaughanmartiniae]|uniref:Uncharacterized protein n=1 Tax=Naganishia vaughanmartiniae TaxID=1424756 RepID=A0ACC2XA56_9TREE|nr:hypothetical protein QFC22_002736 [Naganishia vaughanmartiniae]
MPARIASLGRIVAAVSRPQVRYASSVFRMPAMSPTMTEGGIANWKKAEGDTFTAGDVLLEIETDKATIDVEAQDDGIMGKILVQAGENKVPVGQVIAILAEEGDDIASIEVPSDLAPEGSSSASASAGSTDTTSENSSKESASKSDQASRSSPKVDAAASKGESKTVESGNHHQKITHSKPLFSSVIRLQEISKLKGTGRNGMLTKGDVLFALGKIKDARGSAGKMAPTVIGLPASKQEGEVSLQTFCLFCYDGLFEFIALVLEQTKQATTKAAAKEPLDGIAWRRAILAGLEQATKPVRPLSSVTSPITAFETPTHEFDELLEPYTSLFEKPPQPHVELPSVDLLVEAKQHAHAASAAPVKAVKDEWEGLF